MNLWEGAQTSHARSNKAPNRPVGAKTDNKPGPMRTMTARARHIEQNNAVGQAIATALESYGTHTGINPVPATSSDSFNKRALEVWDQWCEVCDVGSRLHFYQIQALIDVRVFFDRDIFTLLTFNDEFLPRIQLIESHRCGSVVNSSNDSREFDGVIVDDRGRPVQYRFFEDTESQFLREEDSVLKDANDVVIHFEPTRVGQVRGVSKLKAVINAIQDLDELEKAEMKTAKKHALIAEIISNLSGEVEGDPTKERFSTETKTIQGESDEEAKEILEFYRESFGEEVKYVKRGDKYELATSNRPSPAWVGYVRHLLRKICVGTGMSLELIWEPSDQGGATMRFQLEKDDRFFARRQFARIQEYKRIYRYVIGRHIDLGFLGNAPKDWFKADWKTPKKASVDIGRDAKATAQNYKMGATTLQDIHGDAGDDWRKKLGQKGEEVAYAAVLAKELSEKYRIEITREEILQLDENEISAKAKEGSGDGNTGGNDE